MRSIKWGLGCSQYTQGSRTRYTKLGSVSSRQLQRLRFLMLENLQHCSLGSPSEYPILSLIMGTELPGLERQTQVTFQPQNNHDGTFGLKLFYPAVIVTSRHILSTSRIRQSNLQIAKGVLFHLVFCYGNKEVRSSEDIYFIQNKMCNGEYLNYLNVKKNKVVSKQFFQFFTGAYKQVLQILLKSSYLNININPIHNLCKNPLSQNIQA